MRSAFMNRIADQVPNPDMLIFTDEAVHNRKASAWTKGWSLVGRRCVQRRHFICGQRFSILPILTLDGIIAYDIIPGSVNSERFVQFLRKLVVRLFLHLLWLKSNMETRFPSQIPTLGLEVFSFWIIATFTMLKKYESLSKMKHVHFTLCLLFLQYTYYLLAFLLECKLIFLPSYSPDLNPIEQAFSSIKSYLRHYWQDQTFSIMDRACQNIDSKKAWAFFCASGYVV